MNTGALRLKPVNTPSKNEDSMDCEMTQSEDLSAELRKALLRIQQCEKHIKSLSAENLELKNKLKSMVPREHASNSTETMPPRKIARENQEIQASKTNQNAIGENSEENFPTRSAGNPIVGNKKLNKKIIQASNTNIFEVRQKLVAAKVSDFAVKQVKKNGPVKITLANQQHTSNTKTALVKAGISFHEFLNNDEKRKCFIIRGLVGVSIEDLPCIKQELIDVGLPESIEVGLHETGYLRANPGLDISAPVKLIVPPNFDTSVLSKIRYLNHIVIRFEEFKSKSIVQCKNCQRFGHSAAGCQHEHRCVKCGANHFKINCPRTINPTYKLKCCNCGGEHTANNLTNCQYYVQYIKSNTSITTSGTILTPAVERSLPAMKVNNQISFAQAAKIHSIPKVQPNIKPVSSGSSSNSATLNSSINLRFEDFESKFKALSTKLDSIINVISRVIPHINND